MEQANTQKVLPMSLVRYVDIHVKVGPVVVREVMTLDEYVSVKNPDRVLASLAADAAMAVVTEIEGNQARVARWIERQEEQAREDAA